MISFPNCKINLGLRILEKRSDGFHNIQSVFYPVEWNDVIEVFHADRTSFESYGMAIDGQVEDNLCMKAYRLLEKDFNLPGVKIVLLKNIPMGAGLGGGSADAAFILKMLNSLFELRLSHDQLKQYALSLGSDCGFFIENKACLVTGRGEQLHTIDLSLSGYYLEIIYPDIPINTAWAYEEFSQIRSAPSKTIDEGPQQLSIEEAVRLPVDQWKGNLKNDFEEVIFRRYPEIESIKQRLQECGAVYASLSGSGSAVYGLFTSRPELFFPSSYRRFSQWIAQ